MIRGRNRGLELLRATEAAALSVGRWLGRGDKAGTRDAGHAVMEEALAGMPFEGRIVIGPEGSNNRLRRAAEPSAPAGTGSTSRCSRSTASAWWPEV